MLAYFVVVFSLIGVGLFKILSMKSDLPPGLPLGFDEKPKPGMRLIQKLKELIRKIIRDKVRTFILPQHLLGPFICHEIKFILYLLEVLGPPIGLIHLDLDSNS